MYKRSFFQSLILACIFGAVSISVLGSSQLNIPGPAGSAGFGASVAVLANGNIVVTDPGYDQTSPTAIADVGAVYLYKSTGEFISKITGSKANDRIGNSGIVVLSNGNYLIRSQNWDNGTVVDGGAITFGNGTTGVGGASGVVDASNSLVGGNLNDRIGGGAFKLLSNGNYAVTHSTWNSNRGAVTWLNPATGPTGLVSEANSLIGAASGDRIGLSGSDIGITELPTGKFVITSTNWSGGKGAVTLCPAAGCAAIVSVANSVVGLATSDGAGSGGIFPLPNGNFVIATPFFDNKGVFNTGAATFIDANIGTGFAISAANSLVGTSFNDQVSNAAIGVIVLANGNYVVRAPNWSGGRGASTFGSATTGVSGVVSPSISLVGNAGSSDGFLSNVVPLTNGNYVVSSPSWSGGPGTGINSAATFVNGLTGMTGTINAANSFITGVDNILPLPNGNYVIRGSSSVTFASGTTGLIGSVSPSVSLLTGGGTPSVFIFPNSDYVVTNSDWDGDGFNLGAVTYCSGTTGLTGNMTPANSMIGTHDTDEIGSEGITILANGNYVIKSRNWSFDAGAMTFVNVSAGTTGTVSENNSLVGTPAVPLIAGVAPLTNGNYVIWSDNWNSNTGMAAFGNGITGIHGGVSTENSLMGSAPSDSVGAHGVLPLSNGNYLVVSRSWNGLRGAITFGNGTTGISGVLSAANSLVGSAPNDNLGINGVHILSNGNYLIRSAGCDNGAIDSAGAVTLGNAFTGVSGPASAANSLVGSSASDVIGVSAPTFYPDGSFAFLASSWNNQAVSDAGEVTFSFGNDLLVGSPAFSNSVRGTTAGGGTTMNYNYNPAASTLAVGYPAANRVTLLRKRTPFDFDRDNKADLSVYRPALGHWFYQRSSVNTVAGFNFGTAGDKIAPADYTGDGKTDIAVYRPSEGNWYIMRSEDGTVFGTTFGISSDIPAPSDFDGDGKADVTVFRPSDGNWYISLSGGGLSFIHFGQAGDVPVAGDYDADGRSDIGIFRANAKTGNGEWWIQRSTAGIFVTVFGNNTDIPIIADYSGDGTTDVAFRRPSDGWWYVLQMEDFNFFAAPFGTGTDIPVPGDYDGDGKADFAVFRPTDGNWFAARTTSGILIQQFGSPGDKPVPAAYIP